LAVLSQAPVRPGDEIPLATNRKASLVRRAGLRKRETMTGKLEGKVALVTAAAQGIGRATAELFAREGATVWATDINADKLAELGGSRGITTRRLDVRDGGAVGALVREIGAVDVLFNCAGMVHNGSILDCSDADWDIAFDLNA
jgi:2-keto-3-deoxy-L-fuconate dehydrogenase